MRELERYEADCHTCGIHWSILEDPNNGFAPGARTCPVCQGVTRYSRMLRKGDAARVNKDDPYAPSPADGRDVTMRLMTPAEVEEARHQQAEQSR